MKKREIIFNILVIIVICLICVGYTTKTLQNDTFYTITIGKDILKYGVDMIDHYSIHSIAYTYPHWLYDVGVYLVYSVGCFNLLYIASILAYITIGLLLYFLTNNLYKNRVISAFFAIFAVIALPQFIAVRAQTVTYILFILEVFFIEKFLSTSNKKYLISLPIISILIVNMHCAVWIFFFILFLPCIAEYLLELYKNKKIKIGKILKPQGKYLPCKASINILSEKLEIEKNSNVKYLILVMILCIFTGFLTLNGTTPFSYIVKTLHGDTTNWIGEHQAPVLRYNTNLIFYLCLFITILGFLKQKIKLRDFFLLIGLFILAISSYRHISLLVICSTYPFVRIISTYIGDSNITEMFIKVFTNKFISVILLILFVILSVSNYYTEKIDKQTYVDNMTYPVKLADYMIDNLDVKNIRIFNEYNYGSYLLFRGIPVFVDSRADLYTTPFSGLDRDITSDVHNISLNYDEIFDYYKITHVIVYRYNENFGKSTFYEILDLDPNYNIVYQDVYFALFERNMGLE